MKPRLIVIAGPNGSGKTTITQQGLAHEWFQGCEYLNPDIIAKERFSGWNDHDSIISAAKWTTQRRYQLLEQRQSFAFETVFSSEEKIDFLQKAKEAGYFIRLFFICTESPIINAARVAQRVLEGGHDVPIPKIISSYEKAVLNAYRALGIVDRLYLYDNSNDGVAPKLIARFSDQALVKTYMSDTRIPRWALDLISEASCQKY
jgi:predicted ABC-type ATPase